MNSVVYYIRRGDHIKIGRTVNFRARMRELRPDEVLATEPGAHEVETARHRQFRAHHVAGHPDGVEWFHPADDLLAHIEQVAAFHGVPELPAFPPRRPYRPRPPNPLGPLTEEDHKHLATLAAIARVNEVRHAAVAVLERRYGLTFEQIAGRLHSEYGTEVRQATVARWAQPPGPDRRRKPRGEASE